MKRNRIYKRAEVSKDEVFYREWCAARTTCHVCGIDAYRATSFRYPGLSTHHVVKPHRAHEACNLIRCCQRCHDLAEGRVMMGWLNGVRVQYERLTVGMCLTVKLREEPWDADAQRLEEIYGQRLPAPEPLPMLLLAEYQDRLRAARGQELAWDFLGIEKSRGKPVFLRG
jgi:hypothetical protein